MVQTETPDPIGSFELLITAEEGFVTFENLILDARRDVIGCFRVFDLNTKLRSERAKALGDTWFDLLLDALDRGVSLEITVTDFDPVIATDDHRRSWLSARQFAALNELSKGARMTWDIAAHPARVGVLARTALQIKTRPELRKTTPDPLTPKLKGREGRVDIPLIPATHHQKIAVIDGQHLYIGGLDLNERRYDTKRHDRPAEETWQDVQAVASGPVVEAAMRHLQTFKAVTAGERPATAPAPGFLRTLSNKRSVELMNLGPREQVSELEDAHLDAITRTDGPIYLETQFFRHLPIAEALAAAAKRSDQVTCTLVLPASPEDVAFEGNRKEDARLGAQLQMDCIDMVADAFGARLALATPAQPSEAPKSAEPYTTIHGAPMIYVHSKLSLFGAGIGILSSANLNGRSLKWDTECGVHLRNPQHVRHCWSRILHHWLGEVPFDPLEDQLSYISWLNGALARNMVTAPSERTRLLLPYPRGRDIALAEPLPGVPDAMV